MNRGLVFALLGLVTLAGGCASEARYVQKNPDGSGVVAVSAKMNRNEALAKIQEHVGPNYMIEFEGEVAKQTDRPTMMGNPATPEKEYHIMYRRVSTPNATGGNPMTMGNGAQTYPGGIQQAQGQGPPTGTIPNVNPMGMGMPSGAPGYSGGSPTVPSSRSISGGVNWQQ